VSSREFYMNLIFTKYKHSKLIHLFNSEMNIIFCWSESWPNKNISLIFKEKSSIKFQSSGTKVMDSNWEYEFQAIYPAAPPADTSATTKCVLKTRMVRKSGSNLIYFVVVRV
jgi:hypothetical protein